MSDSRYEFSPRKTVNSNSPIKGSPPPKSVNNYRARQIKPKESPPKPPKTNRFTREYFLGEEYQIKQREAKEQKGPKVYEPFDCKNMSPKRVIYKEKVEFNYGKVEEELLAEGIDFNQPFGNEEWIPLDAFDDQTMDLYTPEELMKNIRGSNPSEEAAPLVGRGLYKNEDGVFQWKPVFIYDYNAKDKKFLGKWAQDNKDAALSRLNLIFNDEDAFLFAQRVARAALYRKWADSIIRYNFFISEMPNIDLNELDDSQRERLESSSLRGMKAPKDLSENFFDNIADEVNRDYANAMNSLIFDKYIEGNSGEVLPEGLTLPPRNPETTPHKRLIVLDQNKDSRPFDEKFRNFSVNFFLNKEEAIKALEEIKAENQNMLNSPLFHTKISHPMRIDEFTSQQDSTTQTLLFHLRGSWVARIVDIIKINFTKVGRGWASYPELKKGTPDYERFKQFLGVVRQKMQDCVYSLSRQNFKEFYDAITEYIPTETKVMSAKEVTNQYKFYRKSPSGQDIPRHPIFNVKMLKNHKEDVVGFEYSVQPAKFVTIVLELIERVLDDMANIPDIEGKLLATSDRAKIMIATPRLPKEQPDGGYTGPDRFRKVEDKNKWLYDLYHDLKMQLETAIQPLAEYKNAFDMFKHVLEFDPDTYIKELEDEDPPKSEDAIKDEIFKAEKQEKQLRNQIPDQCHVSCFLISNEEILEMLTGKYQRLQRGLIELLARRARNRSIDLMSELISMEGKVRSIPKGIEELVELKDFLDVLPGKLVKMSEDIKQVMENYEIMDQFQYKFTEEDLNRKWQVFGGPKDVNDLIENRKSNLVRERDRFYDTMVSNQTEFKENIESLEKIIGSFHQYQKLEAHEEVSEIAKSVNESLKSYQDKARTFNHHESLFQVPITDYAKINQMEKEFQPYSNLWIIANEWTKYSVLWLSQPWDELDADEAERWVEESVRTMNGTVRYFKDRNVIHVHKIAETVKKEIDEFRPKVPLMVALRKKGMKDRHWEQVSDKAGFEVKPEGEFNFSKVLEMGLMKNVDEIVDIGDRAAKEYGIETMLNGMIKQWDTILFELLPFKHTSILKGYDDIGAVLDEHMVNTQAMTFSPFKKPFEEQLNDWNNRLLIMSNILEEWAKCQGNYMYLQPIFDSPDIAKQLPAETRKFKQVDNTWKFTIHLIKNKEYNVLKVCSHDNLLDKITEANENLDVIQKELNNYLEKKREAFARFYFLSNDELLEILSETKEPTKVQPHLRKVFENIHKIEFDDFKVIHSMFSGEGENIKFLKEINPVQKNVEFWMGDVEEMMKLSVRSVLQNSIYDYTQKPRVEWVVSHPGQCVLNGSQVHWTKEVEDAIKAGKIPEYYEKSKAQISELVKLIRTNLKKMQSITVNALIVIDVHARDVIEKLEKAKITDVGAFEWISQLRYYWEHDNCYVKCVQTNFPYGYEYLGNTLRLVITPLTDKCYMTLMGALKLNLGGAPAGPAGTGKTESTKDLAKALAKQCVVFNCSEGMDYTFVGKFFKGLASAGAWACFDEFNRINIEVLSVIAQQLLQLFGAKATGEKELEFESSHIKMDPTFSVFITMNPGYAGRTELPDNLKALFRSVAMMVPDYALIGEIMLYSFGFDTAKDLARKMVATFKLSSEQLSSQDHYDYGMRAVRSVINAAGLLKRADQDMPEDQLLLRALRDVNVPKFLKDDLPLFENIISDLFPKTERPKIDRGELPVGISEACKTLNLQPVEVFIGKVLQLYDTIQVRHGLMIVGPTGGGKTSNYQILQKAMSSLAKQKFEGFHKVHTHILNPKAITMGQLYGNINEQTKEWTDGILANMVRETVKDQSGELHWVMFDGPVDALWIESMNTVLDDNKKLCLNSGQILMLTPYMTMMFEVEDLAVASPATVSRCGMVYMEPVSIGYQPLLDSWLNTLPAGMKAKPTIVKKIEDLLEKYVDDCIHFIKKECKELVATQINALVQSLTKLLDCFFDQYRDTEYKKVSAEEIENAEFMLENYFFFCLVWSIGCTVDLDGRRKFNTHLRELMEKNEAKENFPSNGSVYEFMFNQKNKEYENWSELNKNFDLKDGLSYSEIVVPTNDYTRMLYLMKVLITKKKHIMCPGPTGTGKSLNCKTLLLSGLPAEYQYISITFSAQTTANQTQDTIDSKLEKRRKGIYGPPTGKKCVIFVDDLNMPKKETYGAQPPIELLRQYLDHAGWYDRKKLEFQKLEDLIILTAMGPPGGGRTHITNRITRHFNMLSYTDLEEETIKYIFKTMVGYFFRPFEEEVQASRDMLIETNLYIFGAIKNELRPLPNKSFYTFNLRDISKAFQGICSASPKYCKAKTDVVRLWYHENLRVFHDRLINDEDRDYLKSLLKSQFEKFDLTDEQILNSERIIFGDFMQGRDVEPKFYVQIADMKQLLLKMEEYLDEYNSESGGGKKQMKLVMFLDACEHIARICRILRQPQGNALLLGVGGSGRQSLARMATYVSGYKIYQVEVVKGYNMAKWREDLKKCLMIAGVDNKPITFLFVDTQIIREEMLEDINNILNTGDVTNLYKPEDMDSIVTACRSDCLKKGFEPNKMNIFSQYLERIQRNIHCVIAMSPLGEIFRTRLRMFPSLVSCCTLDWFTEWPEEALLGVGKGSIKDVQDDLQIEEISNELVEMFKRIHKSVEHISIKFVAELRRYNYVTPSSYLEQLNLFKSILKEKQDDLRYSIHRLKNGLDKLKEAESAVTVMKANLVELQPKLAQAEIDTTKLMEQVVVEKADAEKYQKVVAVEEAEASVEAAKATELQKEASEAVAEAQKILDKTIQEIKSLKKEHLVEIKAFKSPPMPVFWTLAGVCVMLGEKVPAKPVPGSLTGEKKEDYFEYSKEKLLANPDGFLQRLLHFADSEEKNNIPPERITKLENKIKTEPDFAQERVKQANTATRYLWSWVNAMYTYHYTYLKTKPLRDKLAETEAILAEKNSQLKQKKDELEKINNQIQRLENQYNESIAEKERLNNEKKECEIKLTRAEKLTSGLKDEKERWGKEIEALSKGTDVLPGDSTIAAGMVAYSGPFTSEFRTELEQSWIKYLEELSIKHTPLINMRKFLGDSVKIQSWNLAGLPKDDTSTENGIIIDKGKRWPLMIDPQTQANKFIKNLGKDREEGLDILKASDPSILKTLELGLQFGRWVLVENVGTELDPALDPIISRQLFKAGGTLAITIGDKTIPYDERFKFYMTTTNPNPHYSPETFVKVTIINFAITQSGLEEQMLAQIVALENPQLEQKKTEIVKRNAQDKKELVSLEDGILRSLSESQGDILMDETLVNKLASSKKMSKEINIRVQESKVTEKEIDTARESYRPVAFRASILFFSINQLANIDPMYQYSLQWYINLFSMGVENAPASTELERRLHNLNDYFTYSLYQNICRSLFEKHKLLFSLLLTVTVLRGSQMLNEEEWQYFLTGFTGDAKIPSNPTVWISDNSWPGIYRLLKGCEAIPALKGLEDHFMNKPNDFQHIYDSVEAHEQPLPEPWESKLDNFEKMIVLKVLRPDKLVPAIQAWVTEKMGEQFVDPPTFDLAKCYKDATIITPLIFVLSAGSDPVADFKRFADEMEFSKKYDQISLGQGQGPKAERMIKEFSVKGGWVLLQNCHLAISWMPELERICEELNDQMHRDFRLWLTSMPTPDFPISVLQNGVKMTLEPPTGLRSNLMRTYTAIDDRELIDCGKPNEFKKLLFGFSLFHAIVQDRRKFGPIGWNIAYEFTNEDLAVCKRQLKLFLDEYDEIPYKVLNYLGAEINYGGRVTDDKDVRLIKTILETYIRPEALQDDYKFSTSGLYRSIVAGDQTDYLNYIKGLPLNPAPEAFGLHENAEITTAENTSRILLETILSIQVKGGSKGGQSMEEVITELATNIQKRTPPVWDFEAVFAKYPTEYNESMNTVLVQEIIRYNRLLEIMATSLVQIKKALKGEIVMSEDLEVMTKNLSENQVPELWKPRSFLSLKPLASWIEDLNKRVQFLNEWIEKGTPKIFWISGFFFPQAFITGTVQNYARRHVIAIDELSFEFNILDDRSYMDITEKPEDGCYIYGMYLEGARWDSHKHFIEESRPKELYTDLPLIHLVPARNRHPPPSGIYNCPIYKVLSRAGTLSTTGHSTNFVMFIELPSSVPENVWIKAGVAAFLALRY